MGLAVGAAMMRLLHDEVDAAVLLPAHRVVLQTQRPVLAETRDVHLQLPHSQRFQVVFDAQRASFSQYHVVFRGADFVAAALEQDTSDAVLLQSLGIVLDGSERVISEDILVEIE